MRPTPYVETGRLKLIADALGMPEGDEAVQALAKAMGGALAATTERLVGEPPLRSHRTLFDSGGEIILHDGAVAAVLLHLTERAPARQSVRLSEWLPEATNTSKFEDFKRILQSPWHFAGGGARCFSLANSYLRLVPQDRSSEFRAIAFSAENPKSRCRPEDDDCPSCSDLLVRHDDAGNTVGDHESRETPAAMHLEATIDALTGAIADGRLSPVDSRVPLGDVRALLASGLMHLIESQFTCRSCQRVLCLTLSQGEAPRFSYVDHDTALWRPFEAVPPLEQWASAERIAAEPEPMRYVDHEPGTWFLVERSGELFLDARYSYSAIVDDSALILLDEHESAAYHEGGHDYLTALARAIHSSAPYREESKYRERDLFRGEHSKEYRALVRAAIAQHTWIAEQRRQAAERR